MGLARLMEGSDLVPTYFGLAELEEFNNGTMEAANISVPGESSPNSCLSSPHPEIN